MIFAANPECGKYMDSRSYNDHKEKLYCNRCYKYLFGPKGVGYGVGAGVLLTASVSSGSSKKQTSSKADDIATASFLYTNEKKTQKPGYIERVDETFCDKKDLQCGNSVPVAGNESSGMIKKWVSTTMMPAAHQAYYGNRKGRDHQLGIDTSVSCAALATDCWNPEPFVSAVAFCTVTVSSVTLKKACYAKEFGPRGYGHGVGSENLRAYE
ncbi:unnamed protein product [Gongylonema pulchrum]|uniref:GATA-type domain-containing protein n=1 Tax=Gongylonema pulchrum TaxID=637853 RepID=A0A183E9I3_9BILA|nr:unnamed protein product [Gongylonema pulchrum]